MCPFQGALAPRCTPERVRVTRYSRCSRPHGPLLAGRGASQASEAETQAPRQVPIPGMVLLSRTPRTGPRRVGGEGLGGGLGKGWGLPLPLGPGLTLHLGHQPHGDGPARASPTATGVESGPLFWVPVPLMLGDVRLVLRSLPFVSFLWRKACSRPSPFATRLVAAVAAPGSGLWRLLPDADTAPPRPARASAFHRQRPLGRSFNLEDLTCSFLSLPVLSVRAQELRHTARHKGSPATSPRVRWLRCFA